MNKNCCNFSKKQIIKSKKTKNYSINKKIKKMMNKNKKIIFYKIN